MPGLGPEVSMAAGRDSGRGALAAIGRVIFIR
jgi:hypothetical protein